MSNSGTLISRNGIFWLAATLVLTQLPHVLHLPLWVSLAGITLILGKAVFTTSFSRYFPSYTLVGLALAAALSIKLQYGYFLGRDPGVAFLFLLVSLKFAETRKRRDVTLLICLSGFLLFTQYFYSQTLVAALVSLPAVFAMGGSLVVLRDYSHNPDVRSVLMLISKLLLQGIPLAAALFFLFPRLSSPLWSLPADAGYSTGLSDSMSPGSISELSLSDKIAFRVEFEGQEPAKQDLYWRGPVFNSFNGRDWRASGTSESIRPIRQNNPITHYTVTLEPHNNRWMFALDMAASLPTSTADSMIVAKPLAQLTRDRQLLANKAVTSPVRYRQSSYISNSFTESEPDLTLNAQLGSGNEESIEFARELRSQVSDDSAYANALLAWFNSQPFYYTLKPSLLGSNPVDEFLFSTRKGFCEHYASAFVFLLRAASVPARVVTGYQGGEMNGDYLIVRQSDAHAWAEAWINGRWQRFDPTAAIAPERVLSGMASALGDDEPVPLYARLDGNWLKKIQLGWDSVNHGWRKHIVNFGLDKQLSVFRSLGITSPEPWQIVMVLLAIGGLWASLVLKLPIREKSTLTEAELLYARFLEKMRRAGLAHCATQGPQEFCSLAMEQFPNQARRIDIITRLYIQLQYAPPPKRAIHNRRLLSRLRRQIRLLPIRTV